MPIAETDGYLAAEASANRLIDELKALKHEVESYREARTALGTTADRLGNVAERLSQLSEATAENVKTLREIGAPQLLEAQRKNTDQVSSLRQTTISQLTALQVELRRLRKLTIGSGVAVATALVVVLALLLIGR